MAKLFGFSIENTEPISPTAISPVPPNNEDASDHYLSSGFFGSYVDIEGVYRTEFDLIKRYREMALHPECDSAIEDIVNEAVVSDTNDSPIAIELSNLNASDGIKNKITHPVNPETCPAHKWWLVVASFDCVKNSEIRRINHNQVINISGNTPGVRIR
jgi:hypothetical protein